MENFNNFIIAIAKITFSVFLAYEAYIIIQKRTNRRWWVRPVNLSREDLGFFETCTKQLQDMDEEHFFKVSRMSVEKFNVLLSLLKERLQRFSKRKAISPEIRLSLTLFFLAQGCNVNVLAWTHKLGISTVRKIVYETCEAIWEKLHVIYLSPSNLIDWQNNADIFFIKTGMPNCLGSIDCKHINIVRPRKSGSLYYNYKKTFSIILLAACDANYVFTYVDVGALGSQSDGGVFARNTFGKQILDRSLEVPADTPLPRTAINFPFYFVADNAFPLKQNIMRPFPGRNLSADKDNFNKSLSKARVGIEKAFGILANRWRVLHTTINASPKNADKIVLAKVVLYNFLMLQKSGQYFTPALVDSFDNGVSVDGTWRRETVPLRSIRCSGANRSASSAFDLRNYLKDYLQNNN